MLKQYDFLEDTSSDAQGHVPETHGCPLPGGRK